MNKEVHVTDPSEELGYTDLIAIEMTAVYEENVSYMYGEPLMSQKGMDELADLFEEVPIPLRAIVYGKFIDEMKTRGIRFDEETFRKPH